MNNKAKIERNKTVAYNNKTVVSDKTQTVEVVHELDLNELSVAEKTMLCRLLLEGQPVPHPLTHEALLAIMMAHNTDDPDVTPDPLVYMEMHGQSMRSALKSLNNEQQADKTFLRQMQTAGDNQPKRVEAIKKLVSVYANHLLADARALLENHKFNRAAGSTHTDWISDDRQEVFKQAAAALAYCASEAHREAMKITTGDPIQLFLDGDYADKLAIAQTKLIAYTSIPTKANWIAFRDSMPDVKANLRDLRGMLLEDSYVTNSMLAAMGQPDRPTHQRHPVPPPDYTPRVIITRVPDNNALLAIELLTPQNKAVIGRYGLVGEVKIALKPADVSPENIRPDDNTLSWTSFFSTKAKFKLPVPDRLRNKMLLLVARIVNKRNQKGDWGDVHTVQAT